MADIPDTMHALTLLHDGYSGTSEGPQLDDLARWVALQDVSVPKPEGRQVLVKIGLANVNPSDIHYIKGEYGQPRRKGTPAGFEGMGTVVGAGEDEEAQGLVGQRVAVSTSQGGSGTWAQYALTDKAAVVPLAKGLKDEDGAALIVNPMTAYAMVDLVQKAGAKSFVMTAASSQLGKLMASLGREKGLHSVATVRREAHRSPLEGLGAGTVLNTERDDFSTMLDQAMKQHAPTILLDAVGDTSSATIFRAMPAGSRWILYGKMSPEVPKLPDLGQLVFQMKTIEGFWLSEWMRTASMEDKKAGFETVQKRFISGAWATDVSRILPLDEAAGNLATAMEGANKGKVLLKP